MPGRKTESGSSPLSPESVEWSHNHFRIMREGGRWITMLGLVFTKRGRSLILTDYMPHTSTMPITAKQLADQQSKQFAEIKLSFEAAGIAVLQEHKAGLI